MESEPLQVPVQDGAPPFELLRLRLGQHEERMVAPTGEQVGVAPQALPAVQHHVVAVGQLVARYLLLGVEGDVAHAVALRFVGDDAPSRHIAGKPSGYPARELPIVAPDEEVLYRQSQLFDHRSGHEQRDERGERGRLQLRREIGDAVRKGMALHVHGADAAVRPSDHARQVPVVSLQRPVGIEQLEQRILVRHAVVVHDPQVIVAEFYGLAHAVVESSGAAEVRAGVVVAHGSLRGEIAEVVARAVGAAVVDDDDVE